MKTITWTLTLACLIAACDNTECTEGELRCTGDVLETCTQDGWVESQDCAAEGMMCHEEMGHCMPAPEDTAGSSDTGMSM